MNKFEKIYRVFSSKNYISLDKKLIYLVTVLSLVLILVSSLVLFKIVYEKEVTNHQKELSIVESGLISSLGMMVWSMDNKQVNVLLNDIIKIPGIDRIVIYENNVPTYSAQKKEIENLTNDSFKTTKYKLYSTSRDLNPFGEVEFYTNKYFFVYETMNVVLKTVLLEIVIILITIMSALVLFRYLVVQHLIIIAKYFKSNSDVNDKTPLLFLDKSANLRDELDVVTESINQFIEQNKITRRQIIELKNKAEEHIRLKNLFLANVSHELRTPLNSIVGVFDIIEDASPAERKIYQNMQKKASGQLLNLVNDILDLTKIESDEFKLNYQKASLLSIVENCVNIINLNLLENRNKVFVDVDSQFPEKFYLDEKRMMQIILNLLTNANKFTKEGIIRVNLKSSNDMFEVWVSDTGIGMSEQKLKDIFEPFVQLESSLHLNKNGIGIGLSITKKLVDQMKGKIEVYSKLNEGTCFKVKLPLISYIAPEDNEQHGILGVPKIKLHGESPEILIVDDAEENRLLLEAYLKRFNCNITFAVNGQDAMEKVVTKNFHLILMDIQMPIMNGLDATKAIRNYEKEVGVDKSLIVALSAYQQKSDEDQAFSCGCNYYLTKPIQKKQFLEFVDKVFN